MSSGSIAAFFDVDGTLTKSDIFRDLVAFRRAAHHDPVWHATWPLRGLFLLALDRVSRVAVNRVTYSWYRGLKHELLEGWAESFQGERGLDRFRPRALDLLRVHAEAGHRIVLVTGALEPIVRPLPRLLAQRLALTSIATMRIEAVELELRGDGSYSGKLTGAPLGEEEKARRVRAVAQAEGIDLSRSFAYGDSIADLPMLRCVGRPAAVAPDRRLRRVARREGWPVLDWEDNDTRSPRR